MAAVIADATRNGPAPEVVKSRARKIRRTGSRGELRRVRETSRQFGGEKERTVFAGEAGQPTPERLVRQFRGDVVVEDLVEPQTRDGQSAEAKERSEDDDGSQQHAFADPPHPR